MVRRFLPYTVFILSIFSFMGLHAVASPRDIPLTGDAVPEMKSVDQSFMLLMKKYEIAGGQVAVARSGRLLYARGFGYGDKERAQPVSPAALFRIASISKTITAVAVMELVQQGKLSLDDKAFALLDNLKSPEGSQPDKRLPDITVRNLLEHSGGWTWENGDPQFTASRIAADAVHEARPASATAIVRYMMSQPLGFTPGTQFAYSNFGYNVLGRIIEHVSGRPYEEYVGKEVLARAGITRMQLGRTRLQDRLPDEVWYDDGPEADTRWSVFEEETSPVPLSYGDFALESLDAHGGWVGSAVDLLRLVRAVDGKSHVIRILTPESVKVMTERPRLPEYERKSRYYAKGWVVDVDKGLWNNTGALTWGTSSVLYRFKNDVSIAVLFNHLPRDVESFFAEIESVTIPKALGSITFWPKHDLFSKFP